MRGLGMRERYCSHPWPLRQPATSSALAPLAHFVSCCPRAGRGPGGCPKTAPRHTCPPPLVETAFCTPRSLRERPSCLIFPARKSRGLTGGPPTCANAGCHTAPTGKRASDFKHEGRFRSERGCKIWLSPRRPNLDAMRFSDGLARGVNSNKRGVSTPRSPVALDLDMVWPAPRAVPAPLTPALSRRRGA